LVMRRDRLDSIAAVEGRVQQPDNPVPADPKQVRDPFFDQVLQDDLSALVGRHVRPFRATLATARRCRNSLREPLPYAYPRRATTGARSVASSSLMCSTRS